MPAFIPPLVSAGLALPSRPQPPGSGGLYFGTLGTLIGADLLNWPSFKKLGSHMISIGGAGVFDGVFLAGILAVVISNIKWKSETTLNKVLKSNFIRFSLMINLEVLYEMSMAIVIPGLLGGFTGAMSNILERTHRRAKIPIFVRW